MIEFNLAMNGSNAMLHGTRHLDTQIVKIWRIHFRKHVVNQAKWYGSLARTKDLRNTLRSLTDNSARRVVGKLIAERSKESRCFAMSYGPTRMRRYEGADDKQRPTMGRRNKAECGYVCAAKPKKYNRNIIN